MNDDDKCRCGTPMPKGGGMCDSCAEMTGSYEEDDMASEEKTLTAREIAEKIISENPFGWPESEGVEELTPDQERHVEVIAEAVATRDATITDLQAKLAEAEGALASISGTLFGRHDAGGVDPSDYDLTHESKAVVDGVAALKAKLSNLLARLHRDGGQYQAQHGTDKAIEDAVAKLAAATIDVAKAEAMRAECVAWRLPMFGFAYEQEARRKKIAEARFATDALDSLGGGEGEGKST